MKLYKYKKKYRNKKSNYKKLHKQTIGEILTIDIIEIVFMSHLEFNTKTLDIHLLYRNFLLNKLYYNIQYKFFENAVKYLFPKYHNKRKNATSIKISTLYIHKIIDKNCIYITFNKSILIKEF